MTAPQTTMRAAVLATPGRIEIREIPRPLPRGPVLNSFLSDFSSRDQAPERVIGQKRHPVAFEENKLPSFTLRTMVLSRSKSGVVDDMALRFSGHKSSRIRRPSRNA